MADTDIPLTAVDVLREHPAWSANTEPGYWVTVCDGCGAIITRSRESSDRDAALAQHQADMLAAAGLLATAEHGREVAARALRDAADAYQVGGWADDLPKGANRPALILGMAQRATGWLRARADRIAAGEGS